MKRIKTDARSNWQKEVEKIGFGFHSTNLPYWDESAYYSFTMNEILKIEKATTDLWHMCLDTVQYIIDEKLFPLFEIPEYTVPMIERSWNEDHPSVYGRLDLSYKDGEIKMLEFNADTPTSLFEAAIVQWYWLQDTDKSKDQFNSIHEKLIDQWAYLKDYLYREPMYFSCIKGSLEDLTTTEYLRDCCIQAGLETRFVFTEDIGWSSAENIFTDMNDNQIKNIFKLYPWEMMIEEEFGRHMPDDKNNTLWIEPSWKMLLSSKSFLSLIWQLFPGHELLLETSFEKPLSGSYVEKPIWSREGSNVTIYEEGKKKLETRGDYGRHKSIYQQYAELPRFDDNYAVIGSWVIGQQAAGIGIRESDTQITTNSSRFMPHLIDG